MDGLGTGRALGWPAQEKLDAPGRLTAGAVCDPISADTLEDVFGPEDARDLARRLPA